MDRLVHSCEVGLDRAEGGNSNWHHREWHTLLVQIVEGNNIVMGTPLTEYNEAIQHLQRRRGIVSVAEQAKNHALMQRATTAGPSATAGPGVETPTSCIQNEFQDCDSMSVDENKEEEGPTEIGQILDEVAEGFEDPTLLRLSEEDVALDMDEVIVEVEELSHSNEDLDDSESGG